MGILRVFVLLRDEHQWNQTHLAKASQQGPEEKKLAAAAPFQINGPGNLIRIRRSGVLPRAAYGRVEPPRLGHVLVFTPDVMKSVSFMSQALGMGLADRAQDVIAFCCVRINSDHHVVAFAKSSGVGFHHASFQVADPDEVGRGGRDLVTATGRGEWGVGRHTIGSNFFHYIQDPWESWFEYYSDMDFIDDYKHWSPKNYDMADSLANWGPAVPSGPRILVATGGSTRQFELPTDNKPGSGAKRRTRGRRPRSNPSGRSIQI